MDAPTGTALGGKTALVTGASVRIGCEIARALAFEGADVVIHYLDSGDAAENLRRELTVSGVKAWTIRADFEIQAERDSLVERALGMAGSLDILVNNASVFPRETLAEATFDSLVRNMAVNTWTPLVLSRDFARLARRGDIVNLIDSRINREDPDHVGYILSKHLLAILTRMTAVEFAPEVRVNGISPALILPGPGMSRQEFDLLGKTVPLKRHGDPSDIVQAVMYLLSAGFVTGQIIDVDGGLHLREERNGPDSHR